MSVDPCIPSQADLEEVLLDTAVESWRFAGVFERMVETSEFPCASRYAAKVTYFRERLRMHLQDAGLDIVEYAADVEFDPGMAVTPLNLGDFGVEDRLAIEQVIEPTVMGRGGVRRMGTVLLRKAD